MSVCGTLSRNLNIVPLERATMMTNVNSTSRIPRRTFLAGAAAGTVAIMKPSLAFGAEANSVLELGLIGCGGRGGWIANLFAETGKYRFVACSDYFQDRVDATGNKFKID